VPAAVLQTLAGLKVRHQGGGVDFRLEFQSLRGRLFGGVAIAAAGLRLGHEIEQLGRFRNRRAVLLFHLPRGRPIFLFRKPFQQFGQRGRFAVVEFHQAADSNGRVAAAMGLAQRGDLKLQQALDDRGRRLPRMPQERGLLLVADLRPHRRQRLRILARCEPTQHPKRRKPLATRERVPGQAFADFGRQLRLDRFRGQ